MSLEDMGFTYAQVSDGLHKWARHTKVKEVAKSQAYIYVTKLPAAASERDKTLAGMSFSDGYMKAVDGLECAEREAKNTSRNDFEALVNISGLYFEGFERNELEPEKYDDSALQLAWVCWQAQHTKLDVLFEKMASQPIVLEHLESPQNIVDEPSLSN